MAINGERDFTTSRTAAVLHLTWLAAAKAAKKRKIKMNELDKMARSESRFKLL
jgi:hypothetical protein